MTQQNKNGIDKGMLYQYSKIGRVRTISVATNEKKSHPKPLKTHPDGGWGWCVVMAAFCVQFIILGLQNSSGVIFNQLVKKFDRSRGETGFVSSISCGIMFILGPITTSLCERFTCRIIALFGGVLCVVGMIASAYATSLKWMYLSFGVTWGLGTSFCYFPTLIILVPYFNKRLALVNGIAASGSGVGTLVLSPFIQWFAQRHGVENMFFMLAGLHGIVFLAGFVYCPISKEYKSRQHVSAINENSVDQSDYERHGADEPLVDYKKDSKKYFLKNNSSGSCERKKNVKLFDSVGFLSLISDKAFMSWSIGLSVFILGYFVPFVHLVRYAKLKGVPEVDAAFLISILSITATIFKVISGKVAGLKQVNKLRMYQSALLVMTVATTLIPLAQSYTGFVVYATVFGISESCFLVMIPLITKDIIGIRRLPLALGITFMSMGFTTVLGAPIAGWIYDAFGRYSYAFYLAGALNASGVLIMFFINVFNQNETHKLETEAIVEDKVEQATSKVIEYTSFASSERIYYSTLSIPNAVSSIKSLNDADRATIIKNTSTLKRSGSKSKQRPHSCVLTPIRENSSDLKKATWIKNNHILEKSVSCMQLERKGEERELLIPINSSAEEQHQTSNEQCQNPLKHHKHSNKQSQQYHEKYKYSNGNCKHSNGQIRHSNEEFRRSNEQCQHSIEPNKCPNDQYHHSNKHHRYSNEQKLDSNEHLQRFNARYRHSNGHYQHSNEHYPMSNGKYPCQNEINAPTSEQTHQNNDKYKTCSESYLLGTAINEKTFQNARVTSL